MRTNLSVYDISETLSNIPVVSAMFPWGITNWKPLWDEQFPWLYVTKFELLEKLDLYKPAHIEMSITGDPRMVAKEIEDMFTVIDNSILWWVDWCLPIVLWGNTTVIAIKSWSMSTAMYDDKENIVMRKTYNFTYFTQQ